MGKSMFFSLVCSAFIVVGCDQTAEQAGKAIEQRVQQETSRLIDKALGTADRVLNRSGPKGEESGTKVLAEASAAGITPTLIKIQEQPAPLASVYCTFDRALDGPLEVRFLNLVGAEIGRARAKVKAKAGEGQFVDFQIDPRIPISAIAATSLRVP